MEGSERELMKDCCSCYYCYYYYERLLYGCSHVVISYYEELMA